MYSLSDPELAPLVRKLDLFHPLTADDHAAVLALPFVVRRFDIGQYVVWDGDQPHYTCVLLSGFAYRHKIAGDGGRQILSIHMRGDIVDLQNSLLGVSDHNVQMLTAGEMAMIPVPAIRALAASRPTVGMAMWYATLVEGSIFREWILNIGRRNARTRIAHLLCEFAMRLELAGLGQKGAYELPITQEQLADAVSLTSVHVNRTLMKLEAEGLIQRSKRMIVVRDWAALVREGDFDPRYLHVGPMAAISGNVRRRAVGDQMAEAVSA